MRTGWLPVVAALLCGAAPAVDWSSAMRVDVAMTEYRFMPDHLILQRGRVYRLHLVNTGKELHEFTAPAFFAASTVRDNRVLANGGQEVSVPAGGSADIDFVPNKTGSFDLTCADHDWAGMVGKIVVK